MAVAGEGIENGFTSRKVREVREVFYSYLFLLHLCELGGLGVRLKNPSYFLSHGKYAKFLDVVCDSFYSIF
jgi:hypothetical protein